MTFLFLDAYIQALTINQQVFNLQVPEVDTCGLDDQASKVTKDAKRIHEDAERRIKEHEELLNTANQLTKFIN